MRIAMHCTIIRKTLLLMYKYRIIILLSVAYMSLNIYRKFIYLKSVHITIIL